MLHGFEWDPAKAESNLSKHGVSFEQAATVFDDPLSRTIPDPEHSEVEDRFLTVGRSASDDLLVVCHCERRERIRIINAQPAEPHECRDYQNETT
jgi:uncharacterized DUF497 family protein